MKRWNLRLKADNSACIRVEMERMYRPSGREFQVDGVETEKACEEQLLVTTVGMARFVLVERKDLVGR